jgi:hypothetical protein
LSRYAIAALGAVAALIGAGPAAAKTPLDDAPVPSLCGHPAGQLVSGALPGIPANHGFVELAALHRPGMIATGKLRERGDRAAVLACSQGGVGWPDNVVIYSPEKTILGAIDLNDVTRGGREFAKRISIRRRVVHIHVVGIEQDGDAACCGSASAHVRLKWDRKSERIRVAGKTVYTERKTIKRLVRAVNQGRRRAVRKLAAKPVSRVLLGTHDNGARFNFVQCYGMLDDEYWIGLGQTDWARACTVGIKTPSGEPVGMYALHVRPRGLHGYKVTGYQDLVP